MARFIDLDDIVPEAIIIRVGGEEWKLPGDIPVPLYLELERLWSEAGGEDGDAATAAASRMTEILLGLFRREHPDMTELPVGARGLMHLVFRYLNADVVGQEADAPARPPAGTTRKRSSSPRRTRTQTTSRKRTGSGSST